jgi:alanine-glyoxylate transaminase/serine-glyoxylate transaminase/serine-pyruvate transaminase
LTCVKIPEGIDDLIVRRRLLSEWGIEVGGGLGPYKGLAWRIGLMGHSSQETNVTLVLSALETCLGDLGYRVKSGASAKAAAEVYAEADEVLTA